MARYTLFLLTICLSVLPGTHADMSTNMANFLATISSKYDNTDQYQEDPASHMYIQMNCVAISTPALPDRFVFYNEWSFNGVVFNQELCDVTEGPDGKFTVAIYNFTVTRQYKPWEYTVDDLTKLTPADLQTPSTASAVFEPADSGEYWGTWPAPRHYVNGKPAIYPVMFDCNIMRVIIPPAATEESSPIPYNNVLVGHKYDVPGLPDGFVNPCS